MHCKNCLVETHQEDFETCNRHEILTLDFHLLLQNLDEIDQETNTVKRTCLKHPT